VKLLTHTSISTVFVAKDSDFGFWYLGCYEVVTIYHLLEVRHLNIHQPISSGVMESSLKYRS
jgi:hypothetical protein